MVCKNYKIGFRGGVTNPKDYLTNMFAWNEAELAAIIDVWSHLAVDGWIAKLMNKKWGEKGKIGKQNIIRKKQL